VTTSSALYLNATRFFFSKFEPTKYYYGLVLLIRSLLICIVPVVIRDNLALQVILIGLIISAIHLVQTQTMPWRVPMNNFIDTGINVCMWMMLMVGSMCVGMTAELDSIKVVGTAIFAMTFALAAGSLLVSASRMIRGGVFYGYFICHHSAHAAAQARLLKIMLQSKTGQAVCLDSDEVSALDATLDIVKSRVGTLIAYLTRCTLNKPWCAAEITIAMITKCKVLAVQTPSFLPPDDDDLSDVGVFLDLQSCNFEHYGITTAHIESALRKLMSDSAVARIDMPTQVSGTGRFEALAGLIDAPMAPNHEDMTSIPQLHSSAVAGTLVISSDRDCDEATAVIYLLKMKMQVCLESLVPNGMCCLCDFEDDAKVVLDGVPLARAVIVLLSSGTLASPQQLAVAACATKARIESGSPDLIPVSIPGFVFPTEDYFAKTLPTMVRTAKGVKFGFSEPAEFVEMMREFFWSTRTALSTHGSDQVLDQEIQDLASRMKRGRSTTQRSSTFRTSVVDRNSSSSKKSGLEGLVDRNSSSSKKSGMQDDPLVVTV